MPFSKQLNKILQGKTWRFFGGIKTSGRKSTTNSPIEELAIPSLITLPLERHLGEGGSLLVKVGDKVKAGQALTIPGGSRNVPLHASTSGEITAINMQVLPHPSGFLGRCITIKPDGLDEKVEDLPIRDWRNKSPQELLQRIRDFGVEGLGGAQFQTAAKIGAALNEASGDCNIFIVNGAECEPVATCDDRLMQERAEDIAQGIEVVRHILKPKAIIVAIEDNKPQALKAMKNAVAKDVIVRSIPSIYPSGAARNLIKICTGIEIPYSEHTSACGIVVDNVETVFAIKQAIIDGIPLIKRVVTVDGQTLGRSGNAFVRLGTSVRFILNAYKLNPERKQRIILGGPFMGFTLPTIDVPITKSTTCVFVPSQKELESKPEAMNCIRCGRCARVCPSRLVPYQLYALSKAAQHKNTKQCGMMDCTECGCCSYVCPSRIALTAQFRKEKSILNLIKENQERNIQTQERIQLRNERLAREEEQRKKKRALALERAKQKQNTASDLSSEELAKKRAAQVALAKQRAAKKRAQVQDKDYLNDNKEDNKLNVSPSLKLTKINHATNVNELNLALNKEHQNKAHLQNNNIHNNNVANNDAQDKNPTKEQDESLIPHNPNKLPSSLIKGDKVKHAPLIKPWPKFTPLKEDMSKVENPPPVGTIIPTSKPKMKEYLYISEENKKLLNALPKSLRKKALAHNEQHNKALEPTKDELQDHNELLDSKLIEQNNKYVHDTQANQNNSLDLSTSKTMHNSADNNANANANAKHSDDNDDDAGIFAPH